MSLAGGVIDDRSSLNGQMIRRCVVDGGCSRDNVHRATASPVLPMSGNRNNRLRR